MRISEVARRSGVPATTLRYYEKLSLISSTRASNGYREYGPEVLERLSFIHGAKQMDLELDQIKWLLQVTATGTCTNTRDALSEDDGKDQREGNAELSTKVRCRRGFLRTRSVTMSSTHNGFTPFLDWWMAATIGALS